MNSDHLKTEVDQLLSQAKQFSTHDLKQSWYLTQQAYQLLSELIAQQVLHPNGLIQYYYLTGVLHFREADYQKALSHLYASRQIAVTHQNLSAQSSALNAIGACLRQLGDYASAVDIAQESLQISKTLQDSIAEIYALNLMASIYAFTEDYQNQWQVTRSALERASELVSISPFVIAQLKTNSCKCLSYLGEHEKAVQYGEEAIELFKTLGNQVDIAYTFSSTAFALAYLNQFERAHAYLDQSLAIGQAKNLLTTQAETYLVRAHVFERQNQPDSALSAYEQSIKLAESYRIERPLLGTYLKLANLCKSVGKTEQAIAYLEKYIELTKYLHAQEIEVKLASLATKHQVEEAHKEFIRQQQRADDLEKQRDQERVYYATLMQIKDDLLSTTSHDLKHPLTHMSLLLHLLQRKAANYPEILKHINGLNLAVQRMSTLIMDVLDKARNEMSQSGIVEQHDLYLLLDQVMQLYKLQAESKHLTFQLHKPEQPIYAFFRLPATQRVIQNLLSNAIKYTPNGGSIHVSVTSQQQMAQVSIRDSGLGMDAEEQANLFQRFYRVESHQQIEGTGLGLFIAKQFLEKQGGKIWVESEKGQGSTFYFTLPQSHP